MRVAVFSTKPYDEKYLSEANQDSRHDFKFYETQLNEHTVRLAESYEAVCAFVNDKLDGNVLLHLFSGGTRLIALRCAGFNNVDLSAAEQLGMTVARVPAYSPNSISEYTVGLILTLSRNLHRSFTRTREGNFSLNGLIGFDIGRKTIGIIGTGKIGALTAKALQGFGCRIIANDVYQNDELINAGVEYVSRERLFRESDIISLHCPLMPDTQHLINADSIALMRDGVMIINTSRGALIDTQAVIAGLKSKKIGAIGIDVYEEEGNIFYEDRSDEILEDDVLARLLTFPNVVVSSHEAFFTSDALREISRQTIDNISTYESGGQPAGVIHNQAAQASTKPTATPSTVTQR